MRKLIQALSRLVATKNNGLHPENALAELTRRPLLPMKDSQGCLTNGAIEATFTSNYPQPRPGMLMETVILVSRDVGGQLEFGATATTLRWVRLGKKSEMRTLNLPLPIEYQAIIHVLRQATGRLTADG